MTVVADRLRTILLTASFIEGAAVMVIELSGAKAIAPYYGTSLYVWGAVLGVTIGALALGYGSGGSLSRRFPPGPCLALTLILGGLFSAAAPHLLAALLPVTESLNVRLGSTVAVALYVLAPVACMGAVSPLIIQLINPDVSNTGRSAGTVYAISTVGGILATFLAGFWLLPEIGIRLTAATTGTMLALTGLGCLLALGRGGRGADSAVAPPAPQRRARPKKDREKRHAARPSPAGSLPVAVLLVVAFIEGGAVMIMELLGARITAPYYGASLYVWASVLAVTLAALALGYFLGGWFSRKNPDESGVFMVLLPAAFLTAISPLIAPQILMSTDALGVRAGSLVACLIYLLPPVACLGMVSPLISQLINQRREDTGRAAGTVYAVSTVGGILATFLAGFYLLPAAGITTTAFLTGVVLGIMATLYFLLRTRRLAPVMAALVMALMTTALRPIAAGAPDTRVLYQSSGILGEWTVLDYGPWERLEKLKEDVRVERHLLLNGVDQTFTQLGFEPLSLWRYPHKIAAYASMKPQGSKALLIGMGGGSIAFELKAMGFDLDIVELDERIPQIVEQYFRYDAASSRLYIDDARHFIRTSREQYDVVVIDLLIGEVQPTHVFSVEGFSDLKRLLRDDALVIINFQGGVDDREQSLGPRSIYKTLEAAGFTVEYSAAEGSQTADGDIFFLASLQPQNYPDMMKDLRYNKWFVYDHFEYKDLISEDPLRLDDAYVLVDDKPRLELLNAETILQWRISKLQQHLRPLIRNGVQIYR